MLFLGIDQQARQITVSLRDAHGDVLLDLYDAQAVPSALRLDREDIVRAASVQTHVDLVGFHLPHPGHEPHNSS